MWLYFNTRPEGNVQIELKGKDREREREKQHANKSNKHTTDSRTFFFAIDLGIFGYVQ